MRSTGASILTVALICVSFSSAQDKRHSVTVFGSYTTSSKLFHNPKSADGFLRRQYLSLEDIFGFGIEFRFSVEPDLLQIGFSVEYLRKRKEGKYAYSTDQNIATRDGFAAIPLEVTPYFTIPIGGKLFRIYIGGGIGMYIGERSYEFADVAARTIDRKIGAGIHIISCTRFFIGPNTALQADIKFRDVQFETSNVFSKSSTAYHGRIIPLESERLNSLINIDGMTFNIGTVFYF